ncbi:MAG: capsular biosynthesis protein [Proteobacteria bacterium]|nr:capsular biosynthesis protein [Pseudomonadota bacterium]
MIDLHAHLLPGIDDGARTLDDALAMARIAVDDGIRKSACTPHIYPGMYENDTEGIAAAIEALRQQYGAAGIPLELTIGADAHLTPALLGRIREGTAPTLNYTRYFLLEPPHHVAPPQFAASVAGFLAAGYVPVITHPERLTWIEQHYDVFLQLARDGAWMQVTSGSLTGDFGPDARYWGERMVGDGYTHILATDAHGVRSRRPELAKGRAAAARLVGEQEATRLVVDRPGAILADTPPTDVTPAPALGGVPRRARPWWKRLL